MVSERSQKLLRGKETLSKSIIKRLNTIMIGSISKFENFFGEIWGHGKDFNQLTEAEVKLFEIWQQCRDEILNNGNAQKRMLLSELDLFEILCKGHHKHLRKGDLHE
jgi:flagellar biosynthesis/type III secretory pathway chaperone